MDLTIKMVRYNTITAIVNRSRTEQEYKGPWYFGEPCDRHDVIERIEVADPTTVMISRGWEPSAGIAPWLDRPGM